MKVSLVVSFDMVARYAAMPFPLKRATTVRIEIASGTTNDRKRVRAETRLLTSSHSSNTQ